MGMQAQFTFIGTGGSMGIPVIGCHCATCTSSNPLDKRMRPSGLIQIADKNFVIDVGPDFRMQALRWGIEKIDGVLISHAHSDHIAGLDDLRAYYFLHKSKMPCLLSQLTFEELKQRYPYLFQHTDNQRSVTAQLDFCVLPQEFGSIFFQGIQWTFFSYQHAGIRVTGFRVGNFAYVSDIRDYSNQVIDMLMGVEILTVSVHKREATEVHFGIEEAIEFSTLIGAKKTYFTHLSHDFEHSAQLPSGFELAYDGMVVFFTIPKKDIHGNGPSIT
jgi:phosphoribosyl 1,2-cyclic phosphate phosphodiesterase